MRRCASLAHLDAILATLEQTTYSQGQWGETPSVATNVLLANYDTIYAGTFGGDVLALRFNVDFSDARVQRTLAPPFGDLVLCNVGTLPLNGMTVRQFLGVVNTLLGGGSSPFSIADLGPITEQLNGAFDGGVPSAFAQDHLVSGACVCPSPTIDCNGVCIDPTSDAANCGSCGHPCASHLCSAGVCQ